MISSIIYFTYYLTKFEDPPGLIVTDNVGMIVTQLLIMLSTLYLARIEFKQFRRSNSVFEYFNDKWNLL